MPAADTSLKDLWVGVRDTPVGAIRIGHQYEPFSLEQLTSSKHLTFLERGLPDLFAPARNVGLRLHDHVGQRLTWAAGAFVEADDVGFGRGDGKLNLTGRITGLPVWRADGRRLLHLGLSVSTKDLGDEMFRFRQRPEAHFAPRIVDTGPFAADRVDLVALEAAVNVGPFHAQGEVTWAAADAPSVGDPTFGGWTVQAGFFLTGEHRPYDTARGVFGRLVPRRDALRSGGYGAWEVAVRASTLDLADGLIDGGEVDNIALAVNAYLNPATRLMLNWVRSERDDGATGVRGTARLVLLRLQVAF